MATLYGCKHNEYLIGTPEAVERLNSAVKDAGLLLMGTHIVRFPETDVEQSGASIAQVLGESHVCYHGYPEDSKLSLQISVCHFSRDNTDKALKLYENIVELVKPGDSLFHSYQEVKS